MTDLFNNSLATVNTLRDRKAAIVCPIFPKGDIEDDVNYRPMSLNLVACKVFEQILK